MYFIKNFDNTNCCPIWYVGNGSDDARKKLFQIFSNGIKDYIYQVASNVNVNYDINNLIIEDITANKELIKSNKQYSFDIYYYPSKEILIYIPVDYLYYHINHVKNCFTEAVFLNKYSIEERCKTQRHPILPIMIKVVTNGTKKYKIFFENTFKELNIFNKYDLKIEVDKDPDNDYQLTTFIVFKNTKVMTIDDCF